MSLPRYVVRRKRKRKKEKEKEELTFNYIFNSRLNHFYSFCKNASEPFRIWGISIYFEPKFFCAL